MESRKGVDTTSERFLPASFAFYGWIIPAKTKKLRKGVEAPA
jgi:hypothetical protein